MEGTGSDSLWDCDIEDDLNDGLDIVVDGSRFNGNEGQNPGTNNDELHVEVQDENQENVEEETKVGKPKRVVKNPQPKLNEQTLKGPKGLKAIEKYFERVKFKGRTHEEHDLNVLLKTYEYLCHRLFPKFPFDSCIERLEKLGTKRATQTEIKKIRMGLNFDFENELMSNEIEQESDGFVDTPNEQFDQLVSTNESEPAISQEQLERIRQNMERAKRLREEKLNSARKTTQNNISNQNSENLGITVDGSSASATNEATNNVSEEYHQINGNEFNFTTLVEDNEDDIEDIINDINTEESNESIRHDNQTNDTILHLHENT